MIKDALNPGRREARGLFKGSFSVSDCVTGDLGGRMCEKKEEEEEVRRVLLSKPRERMSVMAEGM